MIDVKKWRKLPVPAAKIVKPINAGSMFQVSPIRVAHQTISQLNAEIQTMLMKKLKIKTYNH